MRWLITGGCGFIGTSLVKRLVDEGSHQIAVIDNLSVGTRTDLSRVAKFEQVPHTALKRTLFAGKKPFVKLVAGNIQTASLVQKLSRGAEVIVHLAASTGVDISLKDPVKDFQNNALGTLNCLEAARRNHVPRFVFASSGAVLGEQEPPLHEQKVPRPVSPYGAGKLAGEAYCHAYQRSYGINTIILRFGNVYGPGSTHKNSVVAKFIKNALKGQALEIFGDGKQTRDFIYIDDLIEAVCLSSAMEAGGAPQIESDVSSPGQGTTLFQIASFHETTIDEIAHLIGSIAEAKTGRRPEIAYSRERRGDVRRNYSDTTRAKEKLGWAPKIDLREGLNRTFDFFL